MLKYCDKDGIEKTIIDDENINDYVSGKEFPVFFHNNDLRIFNEDGDIEIGEPNDENTHVTHINNDCNMEHELTVNGDMVVGGNIGIEGDMVVGGNINQVGNLADLATDAKNNLVSAINEAATEKDKYWGGTTKKWEQFETDHPAEAAKVEVRYITDDSETGTVADVVQSGNMKAVTSNAVYDAITETREALTVASWGTNINTGLGNSYYYFPKAKRILFHSFGGVQAVGTNLQGNQLLCTLNIPNDFAIPGYGIIIPAVLRKSDTGEVAPAMINLGADKGLWLMNDVIGYYNEFRILGASIFSSNV